VRIIDRINEEYPHMTRSEKAISAYLLANTNEFENLSIQELAERNGISTTTLIRFTRRLGFAGFKEFKQALCSEKEVHPTLTNKFKRIAELSDNTLLSDTVNQAFTCLEDTFANLSPATIENLLNTIEHARRVYTFGMKESYALAHYAYTRLYTVRGEVFLLDVTNGDVEPLLNITSEDTCLVFLFHRYTKQAMDVLSALKKIGVSIILVTNAPYDEIEHFADILVPCEVYGIGVKNTSIAPVCLMDYLCNALAVRNPQQTLDRFDKLECLFQTQETLGS
jgi:DNA-binding MurR/RpiR family transcriptional regulator